MKNGLLIYAPLKKEKGGIFNVGDYIQSLAARQYFDHIDVFLNREELNEYKEEEMVKLIMNGWFMHCPMNWPPSDKILPLFVSFHINEFVKNELTSEFSLDYLKKHEPIGCRDINTMLMLRDQGVNAYFSACLTLTLNQTISSQSERETIYIVDPIVHHYTTFRMSFWRFILLGYTFLSDNHNLVSIYKKYYNCGKIRYAFSKNDIKKWVDVICFYLTFRKIIDKNVFLEAEYISHLVDGNDISDEAERLKCAEVLLRKYASAKYVITSRIHCALPCLSFETPVLYVNNQDENKYSSCRFDGILDFFHVVKVSYKKCRVLSYPFLDKMKVSMSFSNKNLYKEYQHKLMDSCKRFILK